MAASNVKKVSYLAAPVTNHIRDGKTTVIAEKLADICLIKHANLEAERAE